MLLVGSSNDVLIQYDRCIRLKCMSSDSPIVQSPMFSEARRNTLPNKSKKCLVFLLLLFDLDSHNPLALVPTGLLFIADIPCQIFDMFHTNFGISGSSCLSRTASLSSLLSLRICSAIHGQLPTTSVHRDAQVSPWMLLSVLWRLVCRCLWSDMLFSKIPYRFLLLDHVP
jgi:hypothetical protein